MSIYTNILYTIYRQFLVSHSNWDMAFGVNSRVVYKYRSLLRSRWKVWVSNGKSFNFYHRQAIHHQSHNHTSNECVCNIYLLLLLFYLIAFQEHITLARINFRIRFSHVFIFLLFSNDAIRFRKIFCTTDDRNTKSWSQSEMEWMNISNIGRATARARAKEEEDDEEIIRMRE